MNLYLLEQDVNNEYDTYDSAVVCAASEEEARLIVPGGSGWETLYTAWAYKPSQVKVTYLGVADTSVVVGVVLSSFNAG